MNASIAIRYQGASNVKPHEPETLRRLWLKVVEQAMMDATDPPPASNATHVRAMEKYRARVRVTENARIWLLGGSAHFHEVCDLADIDPGLVHSWALQSRDRGWVY